MRAGFSKCAPYLWLVPFFGIIGTIMFFPWIWSLILSFYRWSPMRREGVRTFVGLQNYIQLFSSIKFLSALLRTLLFAISTLTITFLVAMLFALMVDFVNRGKQIYRILFLLPMMVSPSITALMWRLLLHPEMGVVNYFLGLVGLSPVMWLSTPSLTIPVAVTMQAWTRMPFVFILLVAALQTLPQQLVDSARIDGASSVRLFLNITVPWLMPTILFVLLFLVIFCLREFASVFGLYAGAGPAGSGRVLGIYLYETLRDNWELGSGSAVANILILISFLFAFPIMVKLYRGL